jgi:hypothetical protein
MPFAVISGVIVAVGGGLVLGNFLFPSPKPAERRAPASEATVETPPAAPIDSAPAASPQSASAVSADTPSSEPAASVSAPATPSSDALVTFSCKPACDKIECDGNTLPSPTEGVRLSDGPHVCKASAERHLVKRESFTVVAGKDQRREIALIPLILKSEPVASRDTSSKSAAAPKTAPAAAKSKPKPCGTFINPCK